MPNPVQSKVPKPRENWLPWGGPTRPRRNGNGLLDHIPVPWRCSPCSFTTSQHRGNRRAKGVLLVLVATPQVGTKIRLPLCIQGTKRINRHRSKITRGFGNRLFSTSSGIWSNTTATRAGDHCHVGERENKETVEEVVLCLATREGKRNVRR